MSNFDLSVIIPSRNEEWLRDTVLNVLNNSTDKTEVIVILDGEWAETPLEQHDRLTIIHMSESIGQRAATNLGMRVSTAKYCMKLDAHCTVAPEFDTQLIKDHNILGPTVCQVPLQYNLHVFDWVCDNCGLRSYQGGRPAKCARWDKKPTTPKVYEREGYDKQLLTKEPCGGTTFHKELTWTPRWNRKSTMWRFDAELHFQYWNRAQNEQPINETMSCLGACWMVDREHWTKLGMLDERHGSWGQMGTEVSCKYWLSGGRLLCNKQTWFAHLFRTQDGFTFPYPMSDSASNHAKKYSQDLWREGKWEHQVYPLRWLVDKFWSLGTENQGVPGWTEEQRNALDRGNRHEDPDGRHAGIVPGSSGEDGESPRRVGARHHPGVGTPTVGAVYYTDGKLREEIRATAYGRLKDALSNHELVVVLPSDVGMSETGPLTMFMQILDGLKRLDTDYAFLTEHDVLYHPSHFDFRPPDDRLVYYNVNTWKVDVKTGKALTYITKQTSGLCARTQLLIEHYTRRVDMVKDIGFTRAMGFEPGTHGRKERVDDLKSDMFHSQFPNIDLRHGKNLTSTRWRQDQFRDKRNCQGWQESSAEHIPGWPDLPALLQQMRKRRG
jgi:hypothetical protein